MKKCICLLTLLFINSCATFTNNSDYVDKKLKVAIGKRSQCFQNLINAVGYDIIFVTRYKLKIDPKGKVSDVNIYTEGDDKDTIKMSQCLKERLERLSFPKIRTKKTLFIDRDLVLRTL